MTTQESNGYASMPGPDFPRVNRSASLTDAAFEGTPMPAAGANLARLPFSP
jgi:hypothetical protein